MNKWILLFGVVIIAFVFAYTIPVTMANPILSNLLISAFFSVLLIAGIYLFFKGNKSKVSSVEINGKKLTPIQ